MRVPHPIPYQGSKRALAPVILRQIPGGVRRFIEPFAGSGAVSLAVAQRGRERGEPPGRFVLGESLAPLAALWREIIDGPEDLSRRYRALWDAQRGRERAWYDEVRDAFNAAPEPARLLFLLARCVKNAVRFNGAGAFNQSPDRRRRGTRPDRMAAELGGAHALLAGRAEAHAADFEALLADAGPRDFVYLDPPWQGTSAGRDRRYHQGLDRERLIRALERLRARGIPFAVSFDGRCGARTYGERLPSALGLRRLELHAGRSSQATLSGRRAHTVESLYCAPGSGRRPEERG